MTEMVVNETEPLIQVAPILVRGGQRINKKTLEPEIISVEAFK